MKKTNERWKRLNQRYDTACRRLEALESELTAEQWPQSKEHTYWLHKLVETEGKILRLTPKKVTQ